MAKKTGKEYEKFVKTLYEAILASEGDKLGGQKNIEVKTNVLLTGKNGIEREFDIYWEFTQGGFTYKNVIECKDYNSKISVDKIDSFHGKLEDFPNLRGIYATTKGYQSGAKKKAENREIELLVVREQNEQDWIDKNGNPLLREIILRIHALSPVVVTYLSFKVRPPNNFPNSKGLNNEVIITNFENHEVYSIQELQQKLCFEHRENFGEFSKDYNFKGKVNFSNQECHIEGFILKYKVPESEITENYIDFQSKLLGVVEYLNKGKKIKVYDGFTKETEL